MPKNPASALHRAAIEGDLGIIQGLVDSKAELDILDDNGYSALVLALKEDNIPCSKLLISSGADPNIGGGVVGSALHMAAYRAEP